MAKKSAVEKNNKRKRIVERRGARREALKATIKDKSLPMEERFQAWNRSSIGSDLSLIVAFSASRRAPLRSTMRLRLLFFSTALFLAITKPLCPYALTNGNSKPVSNSRARELLTGFEFPFVKA